MSTPARSGGRFDPALGFWLRYVESEGALTEDDGESVVVLLPASLQGPFALPEEVAVTANPEIAREEGALLLLPGHPALEVAAASVLSRGDTGYAHLPWPSGPPISPSSLTERLRESVVADHGRLGVAGQPAAGYLPVLRVGAVLRYAVSLEHRFQEREEVVVDSAYGAPLLEPVRSVLDRCALVAGVPRDRPLLAGNLESALGLAHSMLIERAEARRRELATQAGELLAGELARADAYYQAALESIEHRARRADDTRRELLTARAEATRAEAARRRAELVERHEATYEVQPFRLHLAALPALSVPVEVSRGPRTYSSSAIWLLPPFGSFLVPGCPECGSSATLVAGKERLGCRKCLAPVAPTTPQRAPVSTDSPDQASPEMPARAAAPPDGSARLSGASAPRDQRGGTGPTASGKGSHPAPTPRGREAHAEPARRPAPTRRTTARVVPGSDVPRSGDKLATALWQAVGDSRPPAYSMARHSPLAALVRLYGTAGPAYAVGMLPGEVPERLTTWTSPSRSSRAHVTAGEVFTRRAVYQYSLSWRVVGGKAVAGEVLPLPALAGEPELSRALSGEVRTRLSVGAPTPVRALDPVASALCASISSRGISLVVRALAAWWWLYEEMDDELLGAVEDLAPSVSSTLVLAAVSGRVAGARGHSASRTGRAAERLFDPGDVGARLSTLAGRAPAHDW